MRIPNHLRPGPGWQHCKKCRRAQRTSSVWMICDDGTRLIRESCNTCGGFIRFAPQKRSAVEAADKAEAEGKVMHARQNPFQRRRGRRKARQRS